MSAIRYICCRCDARSGSALGHHACLPPSDASLAVDIASALGMEMVGRCGLINAECEPCLGVWSAGNGYAPFHLKAHGFFSHASTLIAMESLALARGYRWSLSSVGDGTEYRATFEAHLGNPAPSALDTTPARAFARGWLRMMVMDHEMEHPMKGFT